MFVLWEKKSEKSQGYARKESKRHAMLGLKLFSWPDVVRAMSSIGRRGAPGATSSPGRAREKLGRGLVAGFVNSPRACFGTVNPDTLQGGEGRGTRRRPRALCRGQEKEILLARIRQIHPRRDGSPGPLVHAFPGSRNCSHMRWNRGLNGGPCPGVGMMICWGDRPCVWSIAARPSL